MVRRAKIALVSDDLAVRDALKFLVEVDGFAAEVYESVAEILASADLLQIGCIIVSRVRSVLGEPRMTELLRSGPANTPLILCANESKGARKLILESRKYVLLDMPIGSGALLDAVRSLVPSETRDEAPPP